MARARITKVIVVIILRVRDIQREFYTTITIRGCKTGLSFSDKLCLCGPEFPLIGSETKSNLGATSIAFWQPDYSSHLDQTDQYHVPADPIYYFFLGFLKTYVSVSISVLFLGLIVLNWRAAPLDDSSVQISRRNLIFTVFGIMVWVALSGIGGFAFQNTDLHIRNAIFRDLITYDWPVKYFTNPVNPSIPYSLVYYTGF